MPVKDVKRSRREKLALILIFLGMFTFVMFTFVKERGSAKQQILFSQLAIMRQGINVFQMIERRLPSSLMELAVSSYSMPSQDKSYKYIQSVELNDKGELIDPFGNPYSYDSSRGWVKSSTPEYSDW